jgi:hypothetical protein
MKGTRSEPIGRTEYKTAIFLSLPEDVGMFLGKVGICPQNETVLKLSRPRSK